MLIRIPNIVRLEKDEGLSLVTHITEKRRGIDPIGWRNFSLPSKQNIQGEKNENNMTAR